jgi:cobalamin biosynthesis protein CobD/CbiB
MSANAALALIVVSCVAGACWLVINGHPFWAGCLLAFAMLWRTVSVNSENDKSSESRKERP